MSSGLVRWLGALCTVALGLIIRPAHAEYGCDPAISADLSTLVDELAGRPEGSWFRANLNRFDDSWAPLELRPKPSGLKAEPASLIKAWSSFAWDCRRGDLLIYGGGHANYAGNDTYRWRATTRMWERMSLPSDVIQDELDNWTAIDGPFAAPPAAHTYDNNIYLPFIDRFLVVGGSAWSNGGAFKFQTGPTTERKTGPYVFDPAKADPDKVGGTTGSHVKRIAPYPEIVGGQMWDNRDWYGFLPLTSIPEGFISGATAYVKSDGKDVLLVSAESGGTAQSLYRYEVYDAADAYSDSITKIGRYTSGSSGRGAGTYDPHLNLFVRTAVGTKWSNTSSFYFWDLSTPGPKNSNVVFVPTDLSGGWSLNRGYGLDYDPVRRHYLLWGGDSSVWILRPPAMVSANGWTIERAPLGNDAETPVYVDDVGGGVLGKWKYIPELDAFMGLQDAYAGNIWIYKPVGWRRPGTPDRPFISLSASPSAVAPGGDATLTWTVSDADSCVAELDWSGGKPTMGSERIGPLYQSSQFRLRCDGPGGEAQKSIQVLVQLPAPIVNAVAGDGCVNLQESASALTLTGGAVPGALVTASIAGISQSARATANGAWSIGLSAAQVSALPEGSLSVQVQQSDDEGNSSPARSLTIQKDTVVPTEQASVPDLVATSDTGGSNSDDVTSDTTPSFTGSAAPLSSVLISSGGLRVATASATSSGTWKGTATALAAGIRLIDAAIVDACGNVGPASVSLPVIIDATAPTLTVETIAGDNKINATEAGADVVVSGVTESGASLALTLAAGGANLLSRLQAASGGWSFVLSAAEIGALPEGNVTFKVVSTDLAGNKRTVSRTVSKDTAIGPPVIAVVAGDDMLTATERAVTVNLSGTAEAYASIKVQVGGWSKTVKASGRGAWVAGLTSSSASELPLGQLEVRAQATDLAGNVSTEAVRSFSNQ